MVARYFIFISASVQGYSVKKSVNQLIKNERPYDIDTLFFETLFFTGTFWYLFKNNLVNPDTGLCFNIVY